MLTALLSILWIGFIFNIDSKEGLFESIAIIWQALFEENNLESPFVRSVLITSFTTSIWLWLHGLSRVLIRSMSAAQWFMGWLNVKETPLRAIGTTINLIVLTLGILLFPVYFFTNA